MEIGGKQYKLVTHLTIKQEKQVSRLLQDVANGLMAYFGDAEAEDKTIDALNAKWTEAAVLMFEEKDVPSVDEVGSVRLLEVTRDFFSRGSVPTK